MHYLVPNSAQPQHCGRSACRISYCHFVYCFCLWMSAGRIVLCRVCVHDFVSGSAYTYGYATMGEFIAWIIGWDLILEYLFGSATVAVGWSGYVTSFLGDLGLHLPASICQSPFIMDASGWHATGAIINFPAVFIVALMITLLVIGIKESASFNNIIVLIKVTVILLFIGFGIAHINLDNWIAIYTGQYR